MRPLVLITSCEADRQNGCQTAARHTWIHEWPNCDYRFVVGDVSQDLWFDELKVTTGDKYSDIPTKMQVARAWAIEHQYDYVFQACVDTWIHVPRLLKSGYENFPATGYVYEGNPSGGLGYWLSAAAVIALNDIPPDRTIPEDVGVGRRLALCHIPINHDPRYSSPQNNPTPADPITMHLSRGTGNFDPAWMYACHTTYGKMP